MHWGKRVAQAAPDQPSPGGDPPPADGAQSDLPPDPPPALDQPLARAPEPEATPAPADPVDQTPDLSEEKLKQLAEQAAKEEVITVTGSTIERKTLTTPAPLTILNRDDLNASGRSTIGDILQQLPAQANASNAQVNNGDGSTRVDIRGLGAARTLTLINGRRVVPGGTGADSSVDLNAIPLAVIERVEVLKDGASAVYGSDAIAGVVNIITRTDFAGTEASLYTGGSGKGDGFTYDASFVTGHTAENKKGNIIFSAGIQSQDPVFAGDRSYSKFDKNYNFVNKTQTIGGSNSTPGGRLDASNIDIDGDGKGDVVNVCGAGVQYCTHDPGSNVYRPYDLVADLYNPQPAKYLYTPSSRYNVYSSGTYKLRPEVSTFFEATYLNRISDQQLPPELLVLGGGTFVSSKSIYNPLHGDVLSYDRRLEEFGPRRSKQNVDTFRIVGGFQGSVPEDAPALKDWKWELSYNYGRTDATQQSSGNLILSHLANAIGPSFINGNGIPRCGTPSAPIAGCVPMDVLGPSGSIDAGARAYATFTGISSGYNQQQTVLATAHGRIAKLPNNGDLSLAVGTDYRKEAGGAFPDPLTVSGDTTGSASEPTEGTYNVVEGFGELSLVPISGGKYAQWVELDLAARAFRYDSFGSGLTWKAGGLFRTINGIAMRGTYSTAFRAPAVSALFGGRFETNPAATDPCDSRPPGGGGPPVGIAATRCKEQGVPTDAVFNTSQLTELDGGNPKLKAETARVITAGVVFEPPQAKGLAFTVDYWNIDIKDAIQSLGASVILSNCYTRNIQSYCDQIHRDPQQRFAIRSIDSPISNVGSTSTSGLDLAVAYDHKIPDLGRFHGQLETQYLFKYNLDNTIQILHGRDNYDLGVYPKIKWNLSTSWDHPGGVGVGVNLRYVGGYKECQRNDCNDGTLARDVDSWYKADLYGSYTLKSSAGKTTLSVGVNNVFNQDPSLIYIGFSGDSDAATYDYLGRFFYARLTQLF